VGGLVVCSDPTGELPSCSGVNVAYAVPEYPMTGVFGEDDAKIACAPGLEGVHALRLAEQKEVEKIEHVAEIGR
jgi:hypothetical protein